MVQVSEVLSISDFDARLAELNRNQFRVVSVANLGHAKCLLLYEPLPPQGCRQTDAESPTTYAQINQGQGRIELILIKDVSRLVRAIFDHVGFDRLMTEMIYQIDTVAREAARDPRQSHLTELSSNLTAVLNTYRRRHEEED